MSGMFLDGSRTGLRLECRTGEGQMKLPQAAPFTNVTSSCASRHSLVTSPAPTQEYPDESTRRLTQLVRAEVPERVRRHGVLSAAVVKRMRHVSQNDEARGSETKVEETWHQVCCARRRSHVASTLDFIICCCLPMHCPTPERRTSTSAPTVPVTSTIPNLAQASHPEIQPLTHRNCYPVHRSN